MKQKVFYWGATGLVTSVALLGGFSYVTNTPEAIENFRHVGYPQQLRVLLGIAKLAGGVLLLLPRLPTVKEWAVIAGQLVVGALLGAVLWIGFSYLWQSLPVVALVLAAAATGGLVFGVRAMRRSDDLQTMVLAEVGDPKDLAVIQRNVQFLLE